MLTTNLDILGERRYRRHLECLPDKIVPASSCRNNRCAKFYRLTARGRKQLEIETNRWDKLGRAIARILRPAPQA